MLYLPLAGGQSCTLFAETAWSLGWCAKSAKATATAACQSLLSKPLNAPVARTEPHHSHLGEVDQIVLRVVRRSLLDESQVGQVHSQIGHAGRIAAGGKTRHMLQRYWHVCCIDPEWNWVQRVLGLNLLLQSLPQVFEPPLWWDQLLQLVN